MAKGGNGRFGGEDNNKPGGDKGILDTTNDGDHILGTDDNDDNGEGGLLDLQDGNDLFNGFKGDDKAYGNDGNDNLNGQNGNDTLIGGDDADNISGGGDDDELAGGIWNDFDPTDGGEEGVEVDKNGIRFLQDLADPTGAGEEATNDGDYIWLDGGDDDENATDQYTLWFNDGGTMRRVDDDGDLEGDAGYDGVQASREAWNDADGGDPAGSDTHSYNGWIDREDGTYEMVSFDGEEGEVTATTTSGDFDEFDGIADDEDRDTYVLEPTPEENGYDKVYNFEEATQNSPWQIVDVVDATEVDFDWGDKAQDNGPIADVLGIANAEEDEDTQGPAHDEDGVTEFSDSINKWELEQFAWVDGEGELIIDLDGNGEADDPEAVMQFIELGEAGEGETGVLTEGIAVRFNLPTTTIEVTDFDPTAGEEGVEVDENGIQFLQDLGDPLAAGAAATNDGDHIWLDGADDDEGDSDQYTLWVNDEGTMRRVDGDGNIVTDPNDQAAREAWNDLTGGGTYGAVGSDTHSYNGWLDREDNILFEQIDFDGAVDDGEVGEVTDQTFVGYVDENDSFGEPIVTFDEQYAVWDGDSWDFVNAA